MSRLFFATGLSILRNQHANKSSTTRRFTQEKIRKNLKRSNIYTRHNPLLSLHLRLSAKKFAEKTDFY